MEDVEERWDEAYGVGVAGAVLVRLDGFVAWRTSTVDEQSEMALGKALARVLTWC